MLQFGCHLIKLARFGASYHRAIDDMAFGNTPQRARKGKATAVNDFGLPAPFIFGGKPVEPARDRLGNLRFGLL